jgi:hypothetical protein
MLSGSLLRKIKRRRKRRPQGWKPPPLNIQQILAWADEHQTRTGKWPTVTSGRVQVLEGPTWRALDSALRKGSRGLPGGSSLARLLAEQRGYRNLADLPRLTVAKILDWADEHHARTGLWPNPNSGRIRKADGTTWYAVDRALSKGLRGLNGGTSLAKLLQAERGVKNIHGLPMLSIDEILRWADAHHAEHGHWPTRDSVPFLGNRIDTWQSIENALCQGFRGLPGRSSLARLLALHRGRRNRKDLPPYSIAQILEWVVRRHRESGTWPSRVSGAIPYAPGETWSAVDAALKQGSRGLPGGSSLAKLLKALPSAPPSA